MRQDMHKVIITPGRHSSAHEKHRFRRGRRRRTHQRTPIEDALIQEQCSRRSQPNHDYKELSDYLQPLQRYLEKHVGQPWDKVYSDICKHNDRRNVIKRHIFEHLEEHMVSFHVEIIKGKIYSRDGRIMWRTLWPGALFVHPRTGILCRVREKKQARSKKR